MDDELNTLNFWDHTGVDEYHPRTGDLLFFAGNQDSSALIRYFTDSKWSHVAMVIKNALDDVFYSFEARSDTGKVTLTPLRERLTSYDGDISVRPYTKKLSKRQLRALSRYVKQKIHSPFDTSFKKWMDVVTDHWYYRSPFVRGFLYPTPPSNARSDDAFFECRDNRYICSELVIDALRTIGVDKNASRSITACMPEDMSETSNDDTFRLRDDGPYGPEMPVCGCYE